MKRIRTCLLACLWLLGVSASVFAQHDRPELPKGLMMPAPEYEQPADRFNKQVLSAVFEENFESGAGNWVRSGSWAIGEPTAGPGGCHNSSNCAATDLSGNYANNADDWLISPSITLKK